MLGTGVSPAPVCSFPKLTKPQHAFIEESNALLSGKSIADSYQQVTVTLVAFLCERGYKSQIACCPGGYIFFMDIGKTESREINNVPF